MMLLIEGASSCPYPHEMTCLLFCRLACCLQEGSIHTFMSEIRLVDKCICGARTSAPSLETSFWHGIWRQL